MSEYTYLDVEGIPVRADFATFVAEAFDTNPPRRVDCARSDKNGTVITAAQFKARVLAERGLATDEGDPLLWVTPLRWPSSQ